MRYVKHQHHERHYPAVEDFRATIMRSYVEMLRSLNSSIVSELRRSHGLTKCGPILTVVNGGAGSSYLPLPAPPDLLKAAKAPKAPKVDVPKAKAPKVAAIPGGPAKIQHPGSRGGKWYRDDQGNVRYGEKPSKQFHTPVSKEESAKIHARLDVALREIMGSDLDGLSLFFGHESTDYLDTLKETFDEAASEGRPARDVYVEKCLEAYFDEDEDEEDGETREEAAARFTEDFDNMVESFRELVNNPTWRRISQKAVKAQELQIEQTLRAAKAQRRVVKDSFGGLVSGDLNVSTMRQIAMVWDLGLVSLPSNSKDAEKFLGGQTDPNILSKAVGTVQLDERRLRAITENLESLSIEQHMALASAVVLGDECQTRLVDPSYDRDEFWANAKEDEVFDAVRRWQADAGRTFSDEDWAQVRDRMVRRLTLPP